MPLLPWQSPARPVIAAKFHAPTHAPTPVPAPVISMRSRFEATTLAAVSVMAMPVVSEQWLARLLLRLGRRAEVITPARWTTLAADTAMSVLARYSSDDTGQPLVSSDS